MVNIWKNLKIFALTPTLKRISDNNIGTSAILAV